MNEFDFDAFDEEFDSAVLVEDVANVKNNNVERKEIPQGRYEVAITKLELTKSKTSGQPMLTCWFKIVHGEFENQMIFMHQVINTNNVNARGIQLHKCNEFLRSISTKEISFESFGQYGRLIMEVMTEIENNYEFQLNYSKDKKGYEIFKIEKIFNLNIPDDEVPF